MNGSVSSTAARTAPDNTLQVVLDRLAGELGQLAWEIDRIDSEIGEVVSAAQAPDTSALQHVDLLRQEVEGLQQFVLALSGNMTCGCVCDAAGAVGALKLRDQALRLQGLPPETPSNVLW